MKVEIYPCILAATYPEFAIKLELLESSSAKWIQVDIMDGSFVEHKTITPFELRDVPTRLRFEAHLMVYEPEKYYDDLQAAGFERILIHREIFSSKEECALAIIQAKTLFPEVGLVLSPETEVEDYSTLPMDSIQCMGVHPGSSGQLMLESIYDTIERIVAQNLNVVIAVDGGVNDENILNLKNAGVTRFVMASAVFENLTVEKNIKHFISIISPGGV